MGKIEDLTGKIFGDLIVEQITEKRIYGSTVWNCSCKCGSKNIEVPSRNLKSGNTKSCGCLVAKTLSSIRHKHGACKTKSKDGNTQLDYSLWAGMIQRCHNKNSAKYKNYGGRGIKVCKEWRKDFTLYAAYIRSLPNCPDDSILSSRLEGKRLKLSIDRIKNDKGYKPGNIRWATAVEQSCNKRNTTMVIYKKNKISLVEAVDKYSNLPLHTVRRRIKSGWSIEDALLRPLR